MRMSPNQSSAAVVACPDLLTVGPRQRGIPEAGLRSNQSRRLRHGTQPMVAGRLRHNQEAGLNYATKNPRFAARSRAVNRRSPASGSLSCNMGSVRRSRFGPSGPVDEGCLSGSLSPSFSATVANAREIARNPKCSTKDAIACGAVDGTTSSPSPAVRALRRIRETR